MQIPQKIFSPVGTSFYFYANPSKKYPLYYHPGHVFARNAVAICLAAGKGDRIVGCKTLSMGHLKREYFSKELLTDFCSRSLFS